MNIWGHEAFRKSYVIGKSTLTNDYLTTTLGLTADKRIYPIAPSKANAGVQEDKISVPIYDSNGAIVGYKQIASVPTPNGDNIKSGIPQVMSVNASVASGSKVASGTNVTLSTDTAGATIYYTTNGDTPTTASTAYSAKTPISVTANTTIKAFAVKSGNVPSNVSTFTYTLKA